MMVDIQIANPVRNGRFADVKLTVVDLNGVARTLDLYIDFQPLNDFSNDTSSIAFDFFLVSSLVYGIDNLLERYQFSIDGWAREIEVCFPVNNLDSWNICREKVTSMLTFLTGDYWTVTFQQAPRINFFVNKAKRWKKYKPAYKHQDYVFASLFSGGLDSLAGVIDGLIELQGSEKGLLLSHFDSSSPGANSDQEAIVGYFNGEANVKGRFDWIQTIVALSNQDSNGNDWPKEASFRSRSLLFISIALFCVEPLPNCNVLTIPENGTISLNYPLTPSRTSTLSTRTTHPYYIQQLQALLIDLGFSTELLNPYQGRTKGELVESCNSQSLLANTYMLSVSCGKRGRKMHWDNKAGTSHCGVCMPCIYRRAALHKIGKDNQLYGIDLFSANDIYDKYDFPALFNFLDRSLSEQQIKRTLLVAGSIPFAEIDSSASLVVRVRAEIKKWIEDKGNDSLKRLAHVL